MAVFIPSSVTGASLQSAIGNVAATTFNPYRLSSKTLTFTGGAGAGAIGTVAVFTVTGGLVLVRNIVGRVTTTLTGATATVALGTTSQSAVFIPATTATGLTTTNNLWASSTPTAGSIVAPAATKEVYVVENVIITVATAAVSGGVLEIDCQWEPLTAGATLA